MLRIGAAKLPDKHKAVAVAKGMTETVYGGLTSIVGVANLTNCLATGYQVSVDDEFK